MDNKENILEAWIMVEHLSEGDINLRDKTLKSLAWLQEENYYQFFADEIKMKKLKSYQKGGIVVYFDVFSFDEVIQFLRNEYHLSPPEEEIQVGDKFSFALYFDKELKLNEEMTFFTESYYIRKKKKIPKGAEFSAFEEENKRLIVELFECPEDTSYEEHFNSAITRLLQKYGIETKQCRIKVLENLETDATNLHSFFVKDLEKAKNIKTEHLDAYLSGNVQVRKDLDCRVESGKYNPDIFIRILQPENYPVSRFPSNPKYALSLMQQIAVNLAIGFDNKQMRSVNGPPGTGKTTLLKDIFAELVVEQALEIAKMPDKVVKGSDKTTYYENASIGQMPEKIAEKGIIVASSNNGAVQNIVNELPLISGISDVFADEISKADYFKEIANARVFTKWVKDENGKPHEELYCEKNEEGEKYWGIFSLEGGKKDNMDYIITVLKHVVNHLENEYIPDDEIDRKFMKQYEEVCAFKKERQTVAYIHNISSDIEECNRQIADVEEKLQEQKQRTKEITDDINRINQCIVALKSLKPGWFARRVEKKEYKEKKQDYIRQLLDRTEEERSSKSKEGELENTIRENEKVIAKKRQEIKAAEEQLNEWRQKFQFAGKEINAMNLHLDYDSFQKSNPWFDEEYRVLQSQLFIMALRVRKQFLYENRKNVKAAYIIWGRQKEYLNKKIVISEAWNWINMVIPVISSTFASFSRMCANLEKETLGHLFVDEAGQALPQASVGAIFRSRHVMVVGDPAQIKPVLTLDSSILSMLGEYFGVSKKYLSDSASTQTLVDAVSQYGFYKDQERTDWIGIPLWVHRRCKYPMFHIANKISYGGNMVQGVESYGKAEWYDVCGSAIDKYVKEQGDFLREKISEMIKNQPDIINTAKKDMIYVISPFKNVAFQLAQELKKIGFTRYENGKPTNVGTVHTFQGKEAPIVFLVLGADQKSKGAANWAMGTENPNIMNVAATRAKEEFYVIGDKKLYRSLNSDVVNSTYDIINEFNANSEKRQ